MSAGEIVERSGLEGRQRGGVRAQGTPPLGASVGSRLRILRPDAQHPHQPLQLVVRHRRGVKRHLGKQLGASHRGDIVTREGR